VVTEILEIKGLLLIAKDHELTKTQKRTLTRRGFLSGLTGVFIDSVQREVQEDLILLETVATIPLSEVAP